VEEGLQKTIFQVRWFCDFISHNLSKHGGAFWLLLAHPFPPIGLLASSCINVGLCFCISGLLIFGVKTFVQIIIIIIFFFFFFFFF
jgi:hypothetical protein